MLFAKYFPDDHILKATIVKGDSSSRSSMDMTNNAFSQFLSRRHHHHSLINDKRGHLSQFNLLTTGATSGNSSTYPNMLKHFAWRLGTHNTISLDVHWHLMSSLLKYGDGGLEACLGLAILFLLFSYAFLWKFAEVLLNHACSNIAGLLLMYQTI